MESFWVGQSLSILTVFEKCALDSGLALSLKASVKFVERIP